MIKILYDFFDKFNDKTLYVVGIVLDRISWIAIFYLIFLIVKDIKCS